ncbi:PH domain-containing protein [Clostridium rectalis]|uniref:PH domain-containing protein n=1 Tax=Clostridium rectalis TaxID=2040295 RepID=UPI000F63F5BF|nr:PH domain-containing protein [Clostridium rectalis]
MLETMKNVLNNNEKYMKEIENFLFPGEGVEHIYETVNKFSCVTNKRLLFVDENTIMKETSIVSIPYSKIDIITIPKNYCTCSNNKIRFFAKGRQYELCFLKEDDTLSFYKVLARHICL